LTLDSRLSGFPEGDFLASIVTPVYGFLKREVGLGFRVRVWVWV